MICLPWFKICKKPAMHTHGQWLNWLYLSDLAIHSGFIVQELHISFWSLASFWISECKSQYSQKELFFLLVELGKRKQFPFINSLFPWSFFFFFSLKSAFLLLPSFSQCHGVRDKMIVLINPDCFHSCGKILFNISNPLSFVLFHYIWIMHAKKFLMKCLLKLKVGIWHY